MLLVLLWLKDTIESDNKCEIKGLKTLNKGFFKSCLHQWRFLRICALSQVLICMKHVNMSMCVMSPCDTQSRAAVLPCHRSSGD